MPYIPKESEFALFPNSKKTQDSHPDYTGYVIIDGQRRNMGGFLKTTDKGNFVSGKVFPPSENESKSPLPPSQAPDFPSVGAPAPVEAEKQAPKKEEFEDLPDDVYEIPEDSVPF